MGHQIQIISLNNTISGSLTMERRYRRLVCLIASIGILAVLAVTMFLGGSGSDYVGPDDSIHSGHAEASRNIGDSEGPRSMHHQKVKLARRRCPQYQDMDGKCIDTCNGPNTAVGKVFKPIKQSQILDVLTKHDVYNICYCRGKGCHRVKKVRIATMKPTNDAISNVAVATDVTVSGSNGGTGNSKTNLMLTATPSALHSTNVDKKMTTLNGNTNRGSAATEAKNGAVTQENKGKTGKEMILL